MSLEQIKFLGMHRCNEVVISNTWKCSNPKHGGRFMNAGNGRCPTCKKHGENWSLYKSVKP